MRLKATGSVESTFGEVVLGNHRPLQVGDVYKYYTVKATLRSNRCCNAIPDDGKRSQHRKDEHLGHLRLALSQSKRQPVARRV